MGKIQIWKIILFRLPNEGLERLKSFVVVFLCTYQHGFSFCFFCELRYNTKWKSWTQFIWHLTKRQKFWIFILHCLMKRDGVDKMFPFAKQDIEWGSKYEPKIINRGALGNSHVYQAPQSNCFIAAPANRACKALFSV